MPEKITRQHADVSPRSPAFFCGEGALFALPITQSRKRDFFGEKSTATIKNGITALENIRI